MFYSIGIIITAYMPIFTLQRVEGRLFKPMAWTVSFALLGALIFSMLMAPVLSQRYSLAAARVAQPGDDGLLKALRCSLRRAIRFRGSRLRCGSCVRRIRMADGSGMIGSEFLPHLDEGAIWARATLAPSTGPTKELRHEPGAHRHMRPFRKYSGGTQVGRPDDGTDTTGFFNTEYFIDLKPKEEWRPVFPSEQRGAD